MVRFLIPMDEEFPLTRFIAQETSLASDTDLERDLATDQESSDEAPSTPVKAGQR